MTIPLSEPLPGTSDMHIVVPKGTTLAIPLNVVQTDLGVWGPDAEIFRPHRWIERKKAGIRGQRELLAFSEGCVAPFRNLPAIDNDVIFVFFSAARAPVLERHSR